MPITRMSNAFGKLREPAADLSEADDQQRLAAKLVLSLREVADHTAPDPLCLVVARLGKPPRERQHECHEVLGDRAGIDAAGAREPHAVLLERLARELVGAGKRGRFARGKRSLRQRPEITSTSASPIRCSSAALSRTSKLSMPVASLRKRSRSR
jgi:hypothetical protein